MNILELGEPLARGAEHQVYHYGSDQVAKVPAPWSRLWQSMDPDLAERDIAKLNEYGLQTVPTDVVRAPRVRLSNGEEQVVPYALLQPFLPVPPVRVPDLERPEVGAAMADLFERSQALYAQEGLGVDLVGFHVFADVWRAFTRQKVTGAIHNVLNTGDQSSPVSLCDTRLYDRDAFRFGTRSTLFAAMNLQHEAVGLALESKGYPAARASTAILPQVVGRGLFALIESRL